MPDKVQRSPRRSARFPVACEIAGRTVTMQAANISRGGMMLVSPELLAVGTMAKLSFDLESRGPIEVKGMVRHSVVEKGSGVQFMEVQPQDQERLGEYLGKAPEKAVGAASPPRASSA